MLSLAELYEQRWREAVARHPEWAPGSPDNPTCRQCGQPKTPHGPGRVRWCDACDGDGA